MGTSSSFRSPPTPRWDAFARGLQLQYPAERLTLLLLRAGEPDWRQAFDAPAISVYLGIVADCHETLSDRFAEADRPAEAIAGVLRQARRRMFDVGSSPALPFAERALQRVLVAGGQGERPLADATSAEAAAAWADNRGSVPELVSKFSGQLFGEWAAHITARDAPRFADPDRGVEAVRETTSAVAAEVAARAAVASETFTHLTDRDTAWSEVVDAIFVAAFPRREDRDEPFDGA